MKLLLAVLVQCCAFGRCKDWVYASTPGNKAIRKDQFKTWESYHDCVFGRRQSPVDVITRDVASAKFVQGVLDPHIQRVPLLQINTGHGFQLHETSPTHKELVHDTAGYVEAATGQSKGYTKIHNAKYNFYQVHWHTPSENKIDGKHSAMEAHFVHQLDDAELGFNFSLVGSTHHLAVISVMYNLTEKCNEDLELFWDSFPMTANNTAQVDAVVDLEEVMESALQGGYYMFDGSLTTPPCTEGVQWYLAKHQLNVCQAQVDRLSAALRSSQHDVSVNNRVVQPLNGRVVTDTPQIRFTDNAPPIFLSESTQSFLLPSTIWLLALSLTILLLLLLALICILVCKQQTAPILSSLTVNTLRARTYPLPAILKTDTHQADATSGRSDNMREPAVSETCMQTLRPVRLEERSDVESQRKSEYEAEVAVQPKVTTMHMVVDGQSKSTRG